MSRSRTAGTEGPPTSSTDGLPWWPRLSAAPPRRPPPVIRASVSLRRSRRTPTQLPPGYRGVFPRPAEYPPPARCPAEPDATDLRGRELTRPGRPPVARSLAHRPFSTG